MRRSPPHEHQSESVTTDAEIEAALETARIREAADGPDPWVTHIEYLEGAHILVFRINNGLRLAVPVENLQGFESATPEQLRNYQLLGRGYGIDFPDLDAALHVDALIEGVYGNRKWMAQLGAQGGSSKSERKRQASRANGAKGGRPRKQRVPA